VKYDLKFRCVFVLFASHLLNIHYLPVPQTTHINIKQKQKQQKNDRTSKCQQILPQWSSVD
jgi:hypothetical protein